ncbi:B-cell receptor CD22-like [Alosa alosa]|uniref:B-cell receptor CD22-like n=1 Tax=Alosa alosa TaxID=278164 RepID=UPI00201515AD|nr:B-cell receptor CD22-like [Alosa alosa]
MQHTPVVFLILLHILCAYQGKGGTTSHKWEVKFTSHHFCAVTGSSVVMPCSFTHPIGLMVTKVYWRYRPDHNKIFTDIANKNPKYKGRIQYFWNKNKNKTNCTFKLSKLMMSDNGEYFTQIETEDSKNKWLSRSKVTLSVKGYNVAELSVGIPEPVMEDNDVTLSCNNICSSKDIPSVIWKKNGQDLHVKQKHHNELIFQSVSTGDEGNYSCALKHNEDHPSKPVELNVMFPPRVPSVSVSPASETLEGASVTLTCSSDANPPVESYTWFNRNGSIVSKLDTGKYYHIGNVGSEHTGDYYCEARNLYGASISTAFHLDVHYAPRKLLASLNHSGEISEGSSVTLTCSSDANPPVESYTWFNRNGSIVSKLDTGKYYHIGNVGSEHTGDYYCEARNLYGASNSTAFHLDVHYAPRKLSASLNHSGEIAEGSSVTLTCSSDANPAVENYTWYRRTTAETVCVGTGERINFNLTLDRAGLYYCEAHNSVGSLNSTGVEVAWSGFGWKTTTLLSSLGFLIILIMLIGYVFWRRKKAKPSNNPSSSDNNTQHVPQCVPDNVYEDISGLPLTSAPAQRVDSGVQDDVQYASVQFKSSRGQQVALYSTVQKFKPHPQQLEEVVYVAVNFSRPTAATQ